MPQRSASSGLPRGARRGAKATEKIVSSYREVFKIGREEAEVVLADLANYSGFYRVMGPGATAEDRAFNDGMRAVYGRVFRFLKMTPQEIHDLEAAARLEAITSSEEGEI